MYFRFPFQTEANASNALAFLACYLTSCSLSLDKAGCFSRLESYCSLVAETFYLIQELFIFFNFFFSSTGFRAKVIESSATLAIAVSPCWPGSKSGPIQVR